MKQYVSGQDKLSVAPRKNLISEKISVSSPFFSFFFELSEIDTYRVEYQVFEGTSALETRQCQ